MYTNVVDRDDVGMIEGGGRARFMFKTAKAIGIFGRGRSNDLQCNTANGENMLKEELRIDQ